MLLSAPQHYPRKGTCTRHGNLRPIIPVTSRPRAEMRSRVAWDGHSHVLLALCGAKLCHGPRAGVGLVQRMGGLQLGRSMHTGQQEYNHAMSASTSINGVVDEDTQTAVVVDVPLYTGLFAGSPRNGWMGSLSKICCSLCLLACLLDGSSGLGLCPSDRLPYSARACGDGKSNCCSSSSNSRVRPPPFSGLTAGSIWFVRRQASRAHIQ